MAFWVLCKLQKGAAMKKIRKYRPSLRRKTNYEWVTTFKKTFGDRCWHLSFAPEVNMGKKVIDKVVKSFINFSYRKYGIKPKRYLIVYERKRKTGINRLHVHALLADLPDTAHASWKFSRDSKCRLLDGSHDHAFAYIAKKLASGMSFYISPGLDLWPKG